MVLYPGRHGHPVGGALRAVLAQDYPGPLRVVVSTERCDPYRALARGGDRPVAVVANRRTPGPAGARNSGILSLDTDLVGFCDGDDTWLPGKLAAQVREMRAVPGTELVTCAIEVERDGCRTPRLAGRTRIGVADLRRSRPAALHASGYLIRREALAGGPGALGLVAEDATGAADPDWDLLLRAARRAQIAHLDTPLVRVHPGRAASGYRGRAAALRWITERHAEVPGTGPGAAWLFARFACRAAVAGDRGDALVFAAAALRGHLQGS